MFLSHNDGHVIFSFCPLLSKSQVRGLGSKSLDSVFLFL